MTKVFHSIDIWDEKHREYNYICGHKMIDFAADRRPRCLGCGIEFDDYGNPILESEWGS
jgi:hypothetical protein